MSLLIDQMLPLKEIRITQNGLNSDNSYSYYIELNNRSIIHMSC
jgi:hypothetical protein